MEAFIPLFPLNTVYYPGNILEIQIFEERYKKLFASVIQGNSQLGIFCIKEGVEAYGPLPIPYSIGTLAKIIDYQVIPLSISHKLKNDYLIKVKLIGIYKIKLLYEYESQDYYWIGNIIPCEENYNTSEISEKKKHLFFLEFSKFLEYHNLELKETHKENIIFLCHQALQYLSISLEEKQRLLEVSNFFQRWEKTYQYLREKNQIIEKLNDKSIDWRNSASN